MRLLGGLVGRGVGRSRPERGKAGILWGVSCESVMCRLALGWVCINEACSRHGSPLPIFVSAWKLVFRTIMFLLNIE